MVQTASPPAQEQRIPMSYEEFLAYGGDTTHAEWVNGEVIVFMAATIAHQDLSGFWCELLRRFARKRQLGKVLYAPTEMRPRPDGPAREPDIFFVATHTSIASTVRGSMVPPTSFWKASLRAALFATGSRNSPSIKRQVSSNI